MLVSTILQSKLKQVLVKGVQKSSVPNVFFKSHCSRLLHVDRTARGIIVSQHDIEEGQYRREELPDHLVAATDPKIIYSSYVKDGLPKMNPRTLNSIGNKIKLQEKNKKRKNASPLIIEKNLISHEENTLEFDGKHEREEVKVFYPYAHAEHVELPESDSKSSDSDSEDYPKPSLSVQEEIALRMKAYEEGVLEKHDAPKGNLVEDQDTYNFNADSMLEDEDSEFLSLVRVQGSADPNYPVSKVPCGGCGANLHCQQPSLIGTYSSDLYVLLRNNRGFLFN